jgi:hypothetical protein
MIELEKSYGSLSVSHPTPTPTPHLLSLSIRRRVLYFGQGKKEG